jgi:hypothetical protein
MTTASVGSNGKIGFLATTSYSNSCTLENNVVAPYWDDLYPPTGGGSVRYQTVGTAPNQRFVANWNVPHISGGGNLYDIRAVLHQTTHDVTFCYPDSVSGPASYDAGGSATIGISLSAASQLSYSCNTPDVPSGTVIRIYHP